MYHFLFYSIHANLVFQVSLNQGVAVSLNQSSRVGGGLIPGSELTTVDTCNRVPQKTAIKVK